MREMPGIFPIFHICFDVLLFNYANIRMRVRFHFLSIHFWHRRCRHRMPSVSSSQPETHTQSQMSFESWSRCICVSISNSFLASSAFSVLSFCGYIQNALTKRFLFFVFLLIRTDFAVSFCTMMFCWLFFFIRPENGPIRQEVLILAESKSIVVYALTSQGWARSREKKMQFIPFSRRRCYKIRNAMHSLYLLFT